MTTIDSIATIWDNSIIPELINYIKIPNKSPLFDPAWKANGYMDQAMQLLVNWCNQQPIKNMTLEVLQLPERTPLLFINIPGQSDETILLYGHMDKQPEMKGWRADLGPWQPVLKDDKLYGRGAADDGYAVFAAVTAIVLLQQQNKPHARCIILIEACEESGSHDLPFYLEHLNNRIGTPSLIICLDSGCGDYERLWLTTSLRGIIGGTLKIEVLSHGIHSGTGSGVVPSPFMILRQLLDRIENATTGEILLTELRVPVPSYRLEETRRVAHCLEKSFFDMYPFLTGVAAVHTDLMELLLNRAWRPQLTVTGIDGLPALVNAGNVTVPHITAQLSIRIPPTCDPTQASTALKNVLEKDPPFQAQVSFTPGPAASGCATPQLQDWLAKSTHQASKNFFGNDVGCWGEGGSIPFMNMLLNRYPNAQFVITGVLGPESNAHGPNEFLHIPTAKKVTACVAAIIAAHYEHAHAHD